MKKNELLHCHALLVQVAEDYVERGIAARENFEEYHSLGVTPMALREPRDRHERAVRTLARLLADLSAEDDRVPEPELPSR